MIRTAGVALAVAAVNVFRSQPKSYTDSNILEDSYLLIKHFPDFLLWEYRFASFDAKLFVKGSNSVFPVQEIQKMFY